MDDVCFTSDKRTLLHGIKSSRPNDVLGFGHGDIRENHRKWSGDHHGASGRLIPIVDVAIDDATVKRFIR